MEELKTLLGRGRAKKGMFEGDLESGELEIGQISARLDRIETASEIVLQMIGEYRTIAGDNPFLGFNIASNGTEPRNVEGDLLRK